MRAHRERRMRPERNERFAQQHKRHLAQFLLLVVAATGVAATAPLHRAVLAAIAAAEPVIRQHALAGAIVFVLLSALSAIAFFFSTAVITPALGELPFAAGAVYLGESFLQRNYILLLGIGMTGVAFTWMMFRHAAKAWSSSDGETSDVRTMRLPMDDGDRRDRGDRQPEVFDHVEANGRV